MIQWLSGWLKEIIFIILIATFVDLILPNSTMQRYARVVISLFILLIILSPMVHLLNSEIDMKSMDPFSAKIASIGQMKPLKAIMKDSSRLQADYEEQALRIAESRFAVMVKEKIETTESVSIQSVKAKLAVTGEGEPAVDTIQIVLSAEDELQDGAAHGQAEAMKDEIQPVKPVVIQIDVGEKNSRSVSGKKTNNEKITDEMKRVREQIARQVTEDWNIPPDRISVKYDIENE